MRLGLSSLGSAISVLLMLLLCQSYSTADNVLSGSGNFVTPVWVNLNDASGNIANFGPDSLNGSLSFSNTYTDYQQTHGVGDTINYNAALIGGSIQVSLTGAGQSYILNGSIVSGSLSGYFCLSPYSAWCGPWGGAHTTSARSCNPGVILSEVPTATESKDLRFL